MLSVERAHAPWGTLLLQLWDFRQVIYLPWALISMPGKWSCEEPWPGG